MKNINLKIDSSNKRNIFFFLVFFAILSFSLYMFLLGSTIFDLVARKNTELSIREVSSSISSLELEVLGYNNKVTLDKAYELGFVNNTDPKFVSRKAMVLLR